MANQWFRLYHEFATDPKIQMMSEADQRRFIMLLCIYCSNDCETLHDDEVTFMLRVTQDEWKATKQLFIEKNLIDENGKPTAWDKRQFVSDSSTERVARHREKKKKQCNVTVTPPDTDTDTDTDKDKGVSTVSKTKPIPPYLEIQNHYNQILTDLPRCQAMSKKRRSAVASRCKEFPEFYVPDKWADLFNYAKSNCPFLFGANDRGWKADFDFFVSTKFTNLIEGRYCENENGQRNNPGGAMGETQRAIAMWRAKNKSAH